MQQPSGPPPQPRVVIARPPTNTLAVVSLVLGIVCWFAAPVLGAVGAVVTGHLARGQIRRTGEDGAGMALAGLILGYVHLVLAAIGLVILLFVLVALGGFLLSRQGH